MMVMRACSRVCILITDMLPDYYAILWQISETSRRLSGKLFQYTLPKCGFLESFGRLRKIAKNRSAKKAISIRMQLTDPGLEGIIFKN